MIAGRSPAEDSLLLRRRTEKASFFWFSSLELNPVFSAKKTKNDPSREGFIVKGEDSAEFLEEKLAILGLSEREAEEFIIYWLPKLEANEYNYIRFATEEEIEKYMPLSVSPEPDSAVRVNMLFKGVGEDFRVQEQKLETPRRDGFVVVEWGGSELE